MSNPARPELLPSPPDAADDPSVQESQGTNGLGHRTSPARVTRLDYLFQSYSSLLDQTQEKPTWDEVLLLDPTPRKRHLEWSLRLVINNKLRKEDFYKVPLMLQELRRAAPLMRRDGISVDLNTYDSLAAIHRALAPYAAQLTQGAVDNKERETINRQTQYIIDTPELLVVSPQTEYASCFWGRGTRWCTAATESDNAFADYTKNGQKLFVFIDKANGGEKYQLSSNGSSFLDSNDEEFDVDKILGFFHFTKSLSSDLSTSIFANLARLATNTKGSAERDFNLSSIFRGQAREFQIEVLKKQGAAIRFIDNPPSDLCKLAVRQSAFVLKFIKEQTPELCMLAIEKNPFSIEHVKEPSRELCMTAIALNPNSFLFIREQTEDVCIAAVSKSPMMLQHVKNQTDAICLAAMQTGGYFLNLVRNQTPEICMAAVKKIGYALEHVRDQTPEIVRAALAQTPHAKKYARIDYESDCELDCGLDGDCDVSSIKLDPPQQSKSLASHAKP